MAGPISAGKAIGAPCSSRLSILPAPWASGARRRGVMFRINQASSNHVHKSHRESLAYLCVYLWATRAALGPGRGLQANTSQGAVAMGTRAQ